MSLQADADLAGRTVRCPGCNAKLQIPETIAGPPAASAPAGSTEEPSGEEAPFESQFEGQETEYTAPSRNRAGWAESDHANVSFWMSLGIGLLL